MSLRGARGLWCVRICRFAFTADALVGLVATGVVGASSSSLEVDEGKSSGMSESMLMVSKLGSKSDSSDTFSSCGGGGGIDAGWHCISSGARAPDAAIWFRLWNVCQLGVAAFGRSVKGKRCGLKAMLSLVMETVTPITQNFVVSCYSDKDTLCGCKIEGLIFESSTVVIYACKAAEGWNASNICLFVEKCCENCNRFVRT